MNRSTVGGSDSSHSRQTAMSSSEISGVSVMFDEMITVSSQFTACDGFVIMRERGMKESLLPSAVGIYTAPPVLSQRSFASRTCGSA